MKSHASMNRIYRLVFNAALGMWVAVAENARGKGKGGRAASAHTKAAGMAGLIAQPTVFLEYKSRTAARYSQPLLVRM